MRKTPLSDAEGTELVSIEFARQLERKVADQGLVLATLCDMVLGEDSADRSDEALIRKVREILNAKSRMQI